MEQTDLPGLHSAIALVSLDLPSAVVIQALMDEIGLSRYDAALATCAAIPRATSFVGVGLATANASQRGVFADR